MKKFLFSVIALLLLGSSGCASFRRIFSRPVKRHPSSVRRNDARKKNVRHNNASRDPVMDMFKIKSNPDYFHDKDLTSQERALLKQQMHSNDSDALIDSIRSDYKTKQKQRRDWVFGR